MTTSDDVTEQTPEIELAASPETPSPETASPETASPETPSPEPAAEIR